MALNQLVVFVKRALVTIIFLAAVSAVIGAVIAWLFNLDILKFAVSGAIIGGLVIVSLFFFISLIGGD